ncbi:hypothetical protein FHS59_001594 [Algoriphagus iocasae]|uniref:Uncharacterized protein n=1 Tax=Algoriphagus iocasae TaxID=1836499 RepID=A0A841MP26_9BACT|nr:hypothetical protein [Algoriphagus iocasae]MBB6325966.1 hypothetical protein [Algoriphagus iocasae]
MKKNPKFPQKQVLALGASALTVATGFVMAPQSQSESTKYSILQNYQNSDMNEVSITNCIIPGTRCFIMPTVTIKQ